MAVGKDYEDKNVRVAKLDPIEAVKLKMEERGIKAKDIEPLPGLKGHISSVLSGAKGINFKYCKTAA